MLAWNQCRQLNGFDCQMPIIYQLKFGYNAFSQKKTMKYPKLATLLPVVCCCSQLFSCRTNRNTNRVSCLRLEGPFPLKKVGLHSPSLRFLRHHCHKEYWLQLWSNPIHVGFWPCFMFRQLVYCYKHGTKGMILHSLNARFFVWILLPGPDSSFSTIFLVDFYNRLY